MKPQQERDIAETDPERYQMFKALVP